MRRGASRAVRSYCPILDWDIQSDSLAKIRKHGTLILSGKELRYSKLAEKVLYWICFGI
jgi:hypothetical protein